MWWIGTRAYDEMGDVKMSIVSGLRPPPPNQGHPCHRQRPKNSHRQSSTRSLMEACSRIQPQAWFRTWEGGAAPATTLLFYSFY